MSTNSIKKCIFCNQANLAILFQDSKLAIFKDIRPATEHHYLVIPKEHIANPKYLTQNDIPLIEEMKLFALSYANSNIPDFKSDKLRLGFHWAPFNTIGHLHLHVLYPCDQMSFMARSVVFRPNSFWFCEIDATIEYLRQVTPK